VHITEGTDTEVDIVNREVSPTAQFVDNDGAELENTNNNRIVQEEGMTHPNPRIQHDLDFWQKIKDCLPSTSVHVLEEITDVANIEQVSNAAASEHSVPQIQHATHNNNEDTTQNDAEVNLPVQQHVSRNIQNGLDLWARIREYDQRMADEGFTQVLTKAQKQNRKKQIIGTPYQTRAKGGLPSSK
jgi:predicted nucleotidyltransferase